MRAAKKHTNTTVFVGLSGGVDSAVSAALLQKAGYTVIGVFIRIALPGYPCTAGEDRLEAMRVAAYLRMPFREIDLSKAYQETVFVNSVREFAAGRTPNPDTLCNKEIKFGIFYAWARAHGADFVATGHYAKLQHKKDGSVEISAGNDPQKDQSYFLWMVPEEALNHTLFPVGGLRKTHVRALARTFALPNAARKDSQGLCFLGDISLQNMLQQELTLTEGVVLSESGEIIGTHQGAALYTLGQRHGFSISLSKKKDVEKEEAVPHFVVAKDIAKNTITVSTQVYPIDKKTTILALRDTNWIGTVPSGPCMARFRYRQTLISATLSKQGSTTTVTLHAPFYVPEGQSLVLYRKNRCLGGGIIESAKLE